MLCVTLPMGEGTQVKEMRQPPMLIIRRDRAVHCGAILFRRLRKSRELYVMGVGVSRERVASGAIQTEVE